MHDTLFSCLAIETFDVTIDDILRFNLAMSDPLIPDEFIFSTKEGEFKINKVKKRFTLLRRFYFDYDVKNAQKKNIEVDYTLMVMCKVAKWSGYDIEFEPKFMN
jgi:hypothetical protein